MIQPPPSLATSPGRPAQRPTVGVVLFTGLISLVVSWMATARASSGGDLAHRLERPSFRHILGTDQFGRDVAARVVHGALPTLTLSVCVLALSGVAGTMLGLLAAYCRGPLRATILTTTDTLLALPAVFMALAITAIIGPGWPALICALTAVGWTPYCRLVYQLSTVIIELPYIEAARAAGVSSIRILLRHILANVMDPLLASSAVRMANAVLSISALSYLGFGPQPPSADWGATLAAAQPYAERAPWTIAAPAGAIVSVAMLATIVSRQVGHTVRSPM